MSTWFKFSLLLPLLLTLLQVEPNFSQRCNTLNYYFRKNSIWWKLNAYYEVARQLLEKRERDTRPQTSLSYQPDAQPPRGWWEPSPLPIEMFVQQLRRTGCNADHRADCARNDEAVALMHNFVFRQILLQSENPASEPSLFTFEQLDKLDMLEKGPFALNDFYFGAMMAVLREIVREQQNQHEECRMLQSLSSSEHALDLGCPLEYRVNQPGNRSAALEEMVTLDLERGMLNFRGQRPDAKHAIFPTLMDPRSKKAAFWLAASSASLVVAVSKACAGQGIMCECESEDPPQEFDDVLNEGWLPDRHPNRLRTDSEWGIDEYENDDDYVEGVEKMPLSDTERTQSQSDSSGARGGSSRSRLNFQDTRYHWDSGCWHSPNTAFASQWAAEFMAPIFPADVQNDPRQLAFITHNIQVGINAVVNNRRFKCECQVFFGQHCRQAECFWELPSTSDVLYKLSDAFKDAVPLGTLFERRRQNAAAKFTSAPIITQNSTLSRQNLSEVSSTPASPTAAQSRQRGHQQLLRSESWQGAASSFGAGSQGASTTFSESTATELENHLVYMPQPCTQPFRGRWTGRRGNT